ncbi:MAG TPA: hypothetical protein VGO18_22420 [Steroidobacteraceae bacterium]|nr:hypothetical protein [Steroidobacteraceae bacterium]
MPVAVDPIQIGVSSQEVAAIRTPVYGVERAQGRVGGIGVFIELPPQAVGIESGGDCASVYRRGVVL